MRSFPSGIIETAMRRPQLAALAAVGLVVVAAWIYLLAAPMPGSMSAGQMTAMAGMDMTAASFAPWSWREALLLFAMWAVMMVAMMLPSAAPMLLLFSRIGGARSGDGPRDTHMLFFAAGYLTVWWAFSGVAALVQWTLHSLAVLSPGMRAASPIVGAAILIAAGIYQWLPLKHSCLAHCRSPLGFLTTSWREGRGGAVRMGIEHGAFCVGCCWLLMALLFVAGVMNLWWVAALSVVVLLEKTVPGGAVLARIAGVALVIAGVIIVT
ncbi:MAG: DUF2182 domain-containing protein [Gemmatimonadaceae bacterium]